jgi:hypothetical protein
MSKALRAVEVIPRLSQAISRLSSGLCVDVTVLRRNRRVLFPADRGGSVRLIRISSFGVAPARVPRRTLNRPTLLSP